MLSDAGAHRSSRWDTFGCSVTRTAATGDLKLFCSILLLAKSHQVSSRHTTLITCQQSRCCELRQRTANTQPFSRLWTGPWKTAVSGLFLRCHIQERPVVPALQLRSLCPCWGKPSKLTEMLTAGRGKLSFGAREVICELISLLESVRLKFCVTGVIHGWC